MPRKPKELQLASCKIIRAPIVGEVTEPHQALLDNPVAGMKQITFNKADMTSICSDKSFNKPDTDVAIFFVPGIGSKEANLKSKHFHFIIDNRLYRRLTWVDVNQKTQDSLYFKGRRRLQGMSVQRNGKLVYYVVEVPFTNTVRRVVTQAIVNAL